MEESQIASTTQIHQKRDSLQLNIQHSSSGNVAIGRQYSPVSHMKSNYSEAMSIIMDNNPARAKRFTIDMQRAASHKNLQSQVDENTERADGSTMIRPTDRYDASIKDTGRLDSERLRSQEYSIIGGNSVISDTRFAGNLQLKEPSVSEIASRYQPSTFQLLERYNKDQFVILPKLETLNPLAAVEYCRVTDEVLEKELYNPSYMPLENLRRQSRKTQSVKLDGPPVNFYDLEMDKGQQKVERQTIDFAVQEKLDALIKSDNDLLKYEYIEIVKSGKEDEHMNYLLSNPEDKSHFTPEQIRQIIGKPSEEQEMMRHIQGMIKKGRELSQSLQPLNMKKVLRQIDLQYNRPKRKLKDEKEPSPFPVAQIPRVVSPTKEMKLLRLKELAADRDVRIEHAQKMAYQHYILKINKTLEQNQLRSKEYKEQQLQLRQQDQLRSAGIQRLMVHLNVLMLAEKLKRISLSALDYKKETFLRNMKAREIQTKYRNYRIKKYVIDALTPKAKLVFRQCIYRFLQKHKIQLKRKAASFILSELQLHYLKRRLRANIYNYLARIKK